MRSIKFFAQVVLVSTLAAVISQAVPESAAVNSANAAAAPTESGSDKTPEPGEIVLAALGLGLVFLGFRRSSAKPG